MLDAVIFDMDGVLVDSQWLYTAVFQRFARQQGTTWTEEDIARVNGTKDTQWSAYAVQRLNLPMTPQEFRNHMHTEMADFAEQFRIMPGAAEAVVLAHRHFRTGLASGSARFIIDKVINYPVFRGCFDVTLSADEVTAGKPDPDIYLETCRRLGVDPSAAVCIEDSPNGILAGLRAGMKVIAVPDPQLTLSPELAEQVDLILPSLTELTLETLQSLA